MKDYFSLSVIFCSIFIVFGKRTSVSSNSTGNLKTTPETNVPNFNEFDWKLCKALHDVEKNNAVLSSISVKLVLLMLFEGAQENTAHQIRHVIGLHGTKQNIRDQYSQKLQSLQSHGKNDYELDIGTKLFIDASVKNNNDYLQSINKWYNSSIETVDFSKPIDAVISINRWAEQITHGRIQKLITEAETKENTLLLLLNAIYFKGYWTKPFNVNFTRTGKFYLDSKTAIDVPLMITSNDFKISTLESLNARLISLPYAGNKFVMYIILPDSTDGLHNLVSKINPTLLGESIKNMKSFSTKLVLPKFNFEYTSILGPILQKLGITEMFEMKANLTNIGRSPSGSLVVSNVLQKAGLEVNEEGSTAYAATEVDVDNRFGGSVDVNFEVTRPFLFMIQDITMDTIIFVGQVTNPLSHGAPVVSIPIVNTPSQTKPETEINFKMNLDQDIDFQRFTYFDSEIFQEISLSQLDSNFVASPASIKTVLSLLSEGARGETWKQLNYVLRLPNDKSTLHNLLRAYQLSMKSSIIDLVVVNNVFVKNKNSLSNYFKDTATDLYSANISEINFLNIEESVKIINEQISRDTKGLIDKVISKDDFDRNTELLLANAIYFKGNWLVEFNESNTKGQCFYSKPTMCEEVNMMYLQDKLKYGYISDINAQVVELLYKDSNFSMLILLPDENITMVQLLKDLTHNPLTKIVNSIRQRTVNLYLPRFTMNYSTTLSTILKKMGLSSVFDSNANLSSMFSPVKDVFVKDVIHKVTIEVNEKGSTASAVTVVSVMPLSIQLSAVTVSVNRPFIFFIINRVTKSALFSGQVHYINPTIPTVNNQRVYDNTQKKNFEQYSSILSKLQQSSSKPNIKEKINFRV